MSQRLTYGTVRETPRTAIYVVRVNEAFIEFEEADTIAARMRDRLALRGEVAADVVVVVVAVVVVVVVLVAPGLVV